MYLETLPIGEALGHILRHNIAAADGRKALPKGRLLADADLAVLAELNIAQVRVAILEPGDVHEDEAARRLGIAVAGRGIVAGKATHSRVNLLAAGAGILDINTEALLGINEIDGLTIATLVRHTPVRERMRVATIKIIPFAVPEGLLAAAEAIGRTAAGIVNVRPLQALPVGVVLVGSTAARSRIERSVVPAIEARVVSYGSSLLATRYTVPEEAEIAAAIGELRAAGAALLIIAGETSIMDRDDVTPRGIRQAGGWIEHYGAPVEPGNLLLMAYLPASATHPETAVLGAPGCVRSRDVNIVDLLLPRLLSGERISRRDIVRLGHGGLLAH